MGPRVKRSPPSALGPSGLSLPTVEETEAISDLDVTNAQAEQERPLPRIQSAPVLTSHEILAGYEAVTRNKSLELLSPQRPPPPIPKWAQRRPKPLLHPKLEALRSRRIPPVSSILPPEQIESVPSQVASPSKITCPPIPIPVQQTLHVNENIPPQRGSAFASPKVLSKLRKRKSYRRSFTSRIRGVFLNNRGKKKVAKVLELPAGTSQKIPGSSLVPARAPQLVEMVTPRALSPPKQGHVTAEILDLNKAVASNENSNITTIRPLPTPAVDAVSLDGRETKALVVAFPRCTSFLKQFNPESSVQPLCSSNFSDQSPASLISHHANLDGVADISYFSTAYSPPSTTTLPVTTQVSTRRSNASSAAREEVSSPDNSDAPETRPPLPPRNPGTGYPIKPSRSSPNPPALPGASPQVPPRPQRRRTRPPIPEIMITSIPRNPFARNTRRPLLPTTSEESQPSSSTSQTRPTSDIYFVYKKDAGNRVLDAWDTPPNQLQQRHSDNNEPLRPPPPPVAASL